MAWLGAAAIVVFARAARHFVGRTFAVVRSFVAFVVVLPVVALRAVPEHYLPDSDNTLRTWVAVVAFRVGMSEVPPGGALFLSGATVGKRVDMSVVVLVAVRIAALVVVPVVRQTSASARLPIAHLAYCLRSAVEQTVVDGL